jgi:DNA-binding NtrC family response regulator
MKVLVVEDQSDWLARIKEALKFNDPLLVDALRERGITLPSPIPDPKTTDNQFTAREIIKKEKHPFDLVILDLLIRRVPHEDVDPVKGPLLGYELVSDIRVKFGPDVPIVVFSNYLGSEQEDEIARRGIMEFLDMLRERDIAPPNEMLWKENYRQPTLLMKKLARYAIDLTPEDEIKLRAADILVPERGATRRVLRELKRMACSASRGFPRSDVLLLGENGVGKTTFARAYHLLRPRRACHPQLGFEHLDLGSLDFAGSAPNIALFGATDFNGAWSLGAFARSTLYKRGGKFLRFERQELEPGYDESVMHEFSSVKKSGYPESSDEIDFDGCGTLFLDEVVNISLEVQAMLLQALSYDLHTRHVYTTGHEPRRLRVAPTLVFATAQPLEHSEPARHEDNPFRRMKDYLFRIDQMRVTIPPLRDRAPAEVIQLLKALVLKRRPKDRVGDGIEIDPVVGNLLTSTLIFRNNVADLQRIADQVMPEEHTISWQHVGPLFERERPLVSESRTKHATSSIHPAIDYAMAQQVYERYRNEHVRMGKKFPLSQLKDKLEINRREAYYSALVFMDACGCTASKRWPTDEQTIEVFGHGTKAFQTYLHRISPYSNGPFGLKRALGDLAELKIKVNDRSSA